MLNLSELFQKYEDEFLKYERIENPPSQHPDICAFLLLERLVPAKKNLKMIDGADHDIIYIITDAQKLAEVATEDDIRYLVRCGVMYDEDNESLTMFV